MLAFFTTWLVISVIADRLTGRFDAAQFLLQIVTTWGITVGTFYFFSNKTFKPLNYDKALGMVIVNTFMIMFVQILLIILYLFIFEA